MQRQVLQGPVPLPGMARKGMRDNAGTKVFGNLDGTIRTSRIDDERLAHPASDTCQAIAGDSVPRCTSARRPRVGSGERDAMILYNRVVQVGQFCCHVRPSEARMDELPSSRAARSALPLACERCPQSLAQFRMPEIDDPSCSCRADLLCQVDVRADQDGYATCHRLHHAETKILLIGRQCQ